MKKILYTIFAVILLTAALCLSASAQVKSEDFTVRRLTDEKRTTYTTAKGEITLQKEEGIAHLYIEFDRLPEEWSVVASGKEYKMEGGYLHQYVDIAALCGAQEELTLKFPQKTAIADLYYFEQGDLPEFVQKWEAPCEKADLMLLTSHSDDEQLFFAGILPYYAVERKLQVQVVYIVQHFEANGEADHTRPHEQLDGLWAVGIRNYPVMSEFPDLYAESKNRETAFNRAEAVFKKAGITFDDFKGFIVENLRRFKPLVVVSHDLDGEYGHGTHVLCAAALTEAITLAEQSDQYPESAKKFGTHRVEKTYLHLYEENKIEMDWDTPYESLGGKTPFQMTQEGFDCHKSQHWTWFKRWIYGNNGEITKATQIKTYSPCQFGLYDTTVGPDQKGGDFMENVTTYAEREAKEQQDAASQNIPKPIVPSAPKDEGGIPPLVWWIGGGALLLALIIFGIARKKRTRRGYRRRGGRIRI
jgi:LmbE family N-acetylglucosaminyl deacetylase